ncbi:MAG: dihydroorotate dehydrogenase [Thermoprotei archaeon]|nr:MAG: dihydroorotate dehydrogenase [Thermoprotei archaeon]
MPASGGGIDLSTSLAGLRLRNPVVIASGVLGVSIGLMKRAEDNGAAAVTTKTTTLEAREGHPNPVIVELRYGLLNSMGLPNPGAAEMGRILRRAKEILEIPVIASIGASSPSEALRVAELLSTADAFELNASCPHVRGLGIDLMADPGLLAEMVSALKSLGRPVFVKLSAHGDALQVASRVLGAGADGLVAINTLKGMAIDVWARKPVLGGIYGGLSGPAIHPVAVRVVYELYEEFPGVPIVGVGGVERWEDAVELVLAGASAVGVASALRRGFEVLSEILRGLAEYLRCEGFRSVGDLVGLAHS